MDATNPWGQVANAWAQHAAFLERRAAGLTTRMLDATGPKPGDRVLELACGCGDTGIAAAPLVDPEGEVVLSDIAPEMVAVAADRVTARALHNVRTRRLDIQRIDEPDASYDVVLCREGLMFAPDPAGAAAEICRVLRDGGRLAVSVWGPPARNPWLSSVFNAVACGPQPGTPGPFALADPDRLAAILTKAGIADVTVEEVDVPLVDTDADAWWSRTTALAGPLRGALAAMSPEDHAAVRERALAAVAPFAAGGQLRFPGMALLATGRR